MARRFTRFSLRVLLAAITALCCFLAYEVNWIRQRREAKAGFAFFHEENARPAPFFLRLLGENSLNYIGLRVPETDTYEVEHGRAIKGSYPAIQAARRLFPEAHVICVTERSHDNVLTRTGVAIEYDGRLYVEAQ
jgi:hypothetical protein